MEALEIQTPPQPIQPPQQPQNQFWGNQPGIPPQPVQPGIPPQPVQPVTPPPGAPDLSMDTLQKSKFNKVFHPNTILKATLFSHSRDPFKPISLVHTQNASLHIIKQKFDGQFLIQ